MIFLHFGEEHPRTIGEGVQEGREGFEIECFRIRNGIFKVRNRILGFEIEF